MAKQENKPKNKWYLGQSNITQWENVHTDKENKAFKTVSYQVEKVYKKGEEWQTTNSFSVADLQNLRTLIDTALKDRVQSPEQ